MNYLVKFVSIAIIVSHSCDAYEYLYDQDNVDLNWLYDNDLYGQGFRKVVLNRDFDDYIPDSYRKSVYYQPVTSYHPSSYYVDSDPQFGEQWVDEQPPLYVTYETLPLENKPVYFAPPRTEPPAKIGYHYPTPQSEYLPPSKGPITFSQPKVPHVPKTLYLPPTKKSTTTLKPVTRTTKTAKPSTPKIEYLPPIIVPDPEVDSQYLPPLSSKLQPPAISSGKPIRFH